MKTRYLVLEDGTVFAGRAIGADLEAVGELVFNTGMTGYQESITDQSYNGQILTFTYPLIGNTGINADDFESNESTIAAVVVNEAARRMSNWRAQLSLDEFLREKKIPGIAGVDTRMLTRLIRDKGTMKARLTSHLTAAEQISELKNTQLPTNQVSTSTIRHSQIVPGKGCKVVLLDFGMKQSIIRELAKRDCEIVIVPYSTSVNAILALQPDGLLLSNGPGDPTSLPEVLPKIRELQEHVPLFGICLGHQLFSLANSARTYKMKFAHRGFNHAVRELSTGRIDFTSQNHGYAVSIEQMPENLQVTHIEINDQSVEGVQHTKFPAFSVQFHPDAAPGPHDTSYLFDRFMTLMADFKKR